MAPKLYCCPESGNCYKVRLLASLLDAHLEHVELDFFKQAHKTPEYLAINPKGEIPSLVDGDRVFTDSSAILVYLAGTHPDRGGSKNIPSSYWSADAFEQAKIVDWLAFTATYIQLGLCKARAVVAFDSPPNTSEEAIREAQSMGVTSLEILEEKLENQEWLALARPTIADVAVFVYAGLAPMGGVSLEPYPAVGRWLERVRALPGFIKPDGLDKPRPKQ
jgi:glutathione S-transferase